MEDNYKPSKEFTDQSWLEMKALLDKEMPDKGAIVLVPEQGRRNSLLLLLPLLLLMAIVALFFYYQTNNGQSDAARQGNQETTELALLPQTNTESKLLKEEENTVKLKKETNISPVVEGNELDDTYTSASLFEASKARTSRKSAISNSFDEGKISNFSKQKSSNNISNEIPTSNIFTEKEMDTKKFEELPKPFVIPNNEKYFEPLQESEESLEEQLPKVMTVVAAIDGKELLMPLIFDADEPNVDNFKNIQEQKKRLPIFASIGVRNYDFSEKLDYVVGIETIFRKKDKNLGLRTGLNYAQRSTTYLTKEETITISNLDTSNSQGGFGLGGGELELEAYYNSREQLNANPIKYHFVEMPVFLDYKFSKKWSMHGGLSGKALIYASVQNFGLLNGVSFRTEADPAIMDENATPEGDFINTSYFEPQKFNLGATLGVNFQLAPRLGLQARFSQNLFDVYSELAGKQRSKSVEIGMNWRLR